MKNLIYSLTATFILALSVQGTAATETADLIPGRNDVTIRTLSFRDVPPGHPQDPFQAAEAFFATRLEWVYLQFNEAEREKVARVRAKGLLFGGAGGGPPVNWIGDRSNPDWRRQLAMLDLDGNPVIMPHKRSWEDPHYIGDVSNPEYLKGHILYYRRYLDFGASSLQRDEVESTVFAAMKYGGGFTPTGIEGFSNWLRENISRRELSELGIKDPNTFRYDAFLRAKDAPVGDAFEDYDCPVKPLWIRYWSDLTNTFFETLIHELRSGSDHPVTFSCNNTSLQIWEPAHLAFDFAISELLLGSASPQHIWSRSKAARENGKFQVFGSPKTRGSRVDPNEKNILTQKVIATAYASGSASRVPWDIFQQTVDGGGRYFGEPAVYSPFYAFVRAHDWSVYNRIHAFGKDIEVSPKAAEVLRIADNPGLFAFLHLPEDASKPVLVHLVDWGEPEVPRPPEEEMDYLVEMRTGTVIHFSEEGKENLKRTGPIPSRIIINPAANSHLRDLDPDKVQIQLLRPRAFSTSLHKRVVQSGNYSDFVERSNLEYSKLPDGRWSISVPVLAPWGILEISERP